MEELDDFLINGLNENGIRLVVELLLDSFFIVMVLLSVR